MDVNRPVLRATRADFDLIVDFLLARGNRLRDEGQAIRWRSDKEGLHVYLLNPIDFDALHEHFSFADEVRMVSEPSHQFIEGGSEWISIEWNGAATLGAASRAGQGKR